MYGDGVDYFQLLLIYRRVNVCWNTLTGIGADKQGVSYGVSNDD